MADINSSAEQTTEFLPMWNTAEKIVTGYICTPKNDEPVSFRNDMNAMISALTALERSNSSPSPPLIATPVHLASLKSGGNLAQFERLGGQFNAKIHERLVVEIVLGEGSTSVSEVRDVVDIVRQTCRTVLLRAPIDYSRIGELSGIKAYAVGTRLDRERYPDYFGLLERFVEQTENAGLLSYALGLDTLPALTAAICAGFGHVDGPAIPQIGAHEATYPLSVPDLYANTDRHATSSLPVAHQRQVVAVDMR
ncbi:MAG: hypothetical protein RID42_14635 [Alphaproteobacteria bacterium]